MKAKDSDITSFPRLNWNFTRYFVIDLAQIYDWINNIGLFFEITVIIFFCAKFCKRKSYFRTPYFIIFTIGCIFDAIPKCTYLGYVKIKWRPLLYITDPFRWYQGNFTSMWNMILALNRFTAIVCYYRYDRLWTKNKTTFVCIFLFTYPLMIELYKPAKLYCDFTGYYLCPESVSYSYDLTTFDNLLLPSLDCICAIIAILLCSIAVSCQIFRNKNVKIQRIELILLTQSLVSSICLIISAIFACLWQFNEVPDKVKIKESEETRIIILQQALSYIRNMFYSFYHYSGLVVMFALS